MPNDDPVTKAVLDAKEALGKATKFTESVEGNPVSTFAPPPIPPPKVPQARQPSYSLARQASSTSAGLKARRENVKQYLQSTK